MLCRQRQVPRRLPTGEHDDPPGDGALFRAIAHALHLLLMTLEIAALDALDLFVVVANESSTLSSADKCRNFPNSADSKKTPAARCPTPQKLVES